MSGRVYLLGVGLVLVALAFIVTDAALGPRPGVTEANVRRMWRGMTRQEATRLLGSPGVELADNSVIWLTESCSVRVWFEGSPPGAVRARGPHSLDRVVLTGHLSPLSRLRAWLGW
jgi:hypothetical protein